MYSLPISLQLFFRNSLQEALLFQTRRLSAVLKLIIPFSAAGSGGIHAIGKQADWCPYRAGQEIEPVRFIRVATEVRNKLDIRIP